MSQELTPHERATASAQLIPAEAKDKLKRFWADNGKHIMSVVAGKDNKALEAALYSCICRTPKLLNCTPFSLLNSLVLANQLGLRPGTQECAVVPYGSEAQLLIQYQGKVKLALASKLIKSIEADVVYDFEEFHWMRTAAGLDFFHRPDFKKRALSDSVATEKNIIGAYCQMLTDGGVQTRFVDLGEILDARAKSKSYRDKPEKSFWTTDFAAACLKTAVHRGCKLAPQDARLGRSTEIDDEEVGGPAVIAEGLDPSEFTADDTQRPIAELSSDKQAEVANRKLGRSAKPVAVKTEPASTEPCITQDQQDTMGSVWQSVPRPHGTLNRFLDLNGVPGGALGNVPVSRYKELLDLMNLGDAQ